MKKLFFILILLVINIYPQSDKKIFLWIDGTANFQTFSYQDSILFYLNKVKDIGVTDIIVDVKPISGEVLYPSKIAPIMKEWKGFVREQQFDYLQSFIEYGKSLGLKVHASMNVFTEGHIKFKRGRVYGDKKEWKSMNHTKKGIKEITELSNLNSASVNPIDKTVQEYELSIIKEIVENYSIDGIVLDRARFESIESDFSLLTKFEFEKFIGKNILNYPEDIFDWVQSKEGIWERKQGTLFKKWIEFRAFVIYDFFNQANSLIKKINSRISFGNFNGSWYPTYYEHGVNWASSNYDPSKEFSWATDKIKNYSILNFLDYDLSGCFFYAVDTNDVVEYLKYLDEKKISRIRRPELWESVEGAVSLGNKITQNEKPIFPSLFLLMYKDNPNQLQKAIDICFDTNTGIMLFDFIYIKDYQWWTLIKTSIEKNNIIKEGL